MLNKILNTIFGEDPTAAGEGLESSIIHTWPWPAWVALLLVIVAAIVVIAIYLRDGKMAGRWRTAVLVSLRLALILLVVFLMYGWMRHRFRTDLPDLILAIDDSESMATVDQYDDEQLRSKLLTRLSSLDLNGLSRMNLAKMILSERDGEFIRKIQRKYNPKIFRISESARTESVSGNDMSKTIQDFDATGKSSRLGTAVRNVLEAQRGRPTAAIVLLTDGITTEGRSLGEAAQYARRKNVPFYIIGLGTDQPPRDIRLSDLLVDEIAFVGDLLSFNVALTATGFKGKQVKIRLRDASGQKVLAETTETIDGDSKVKLVRLAYRPREVGEFEYVVEAESLKGESDPGNNEQRQHVNVRDETIRVLLVQEYPSPEYRFLKTFLERSERRREGETRQTIELTAVLQEADEEYAKQDLSARRVFPVRRDELFEYDVLIFGDVNRTFLSSSIMENISAFVTERGGGVVFLSGPRHTPLAYRDSPLENLFPIDLYTASVPDPRGNIDDGFRAQPTRLGLSSPQMQLEDRQTNNLVVWQKLPELFWYVDAPDLRPGARVLVEHESKTGNTGQPLPIVCIQFVGAGKVVYHGTDEIYRWSRVRGNDHYYNRYWVQTIRYLSRSRLLGSSRAAKMTSDRDDYRRGEPVQLRVRFFDDRAAPTKDDGVTVVLEREGSKKRQVKLARDPTSRGIFEATITGLAEGTYRAWMATPTLDGKPPARQFSVTAPRHEKSRLKMDTADMRKAAAKSDGNYYTVETASKLVNDLPEGRQVRIETLPPEPVWNSSIFAALFVVLLTSEWLLRKRWGML